jgi:hypothetical protein
MTKPVRRLLVGAVLGFAIGFLLFTVFVCCVREDFDFFELPDTLFWSFLFYMVTGVWFFALALGGFCGSVISCLVGDVSAWQKVGRVALVTAIALFVLFLGGSWVIKNSFTLGP